MRVCDPVVPAAFADRLVDKLSDDLGPHTAQQALRLVCRKAGCTPESFDLSHLDAVDALLHGMLRTLVGGARARKLIDEIRGGS